VKAFAANKLTSPQAISRISNVLKTSVSETYCGPFTGLNFAQGEFFSVVI